MSEENQPMEPAATSGDNEQLQRSVEALERKNQELIAELRAAKKIKLPDGVNVDELLEFKRRAEQAELESQGKYSEARQALEQQYREATAQKDQRITELEARCRELELVTPAVTALADIVHDPDMVLKTKLSSDQIERDPDGTVVVVDGYQRTPVGEWAKTLPAWMQKQPRPQGSGAPSGRSSGELPLGIKNPFAQESFNLTEQSRLFRTDRDMYERLKTAAAR
jgi:multidrug efflux pump subunit AcrA (membrane-fusion protein)